MSYSSTHLFQYRHCSSIQYQGKDLDIGRRRGAEVSCGSRELVSGWLSKNKDSRSPAPGAQRATSLLTWQSVALESLHSLTMFHSVLQQVICDMQIIARRSSRFICSPVLSHGCCCVAFVLLQCYLSQPQILEVHDTTFRRRREVCRTMIWVWNKSAHYYKPVAYLPCKSHWGISVVLSRSWLFRIYHWLTLAVQLLQKCCSVLRKET